MKFKSNVIIAIIVVTMSLLLGASAAQAATVETDDDGNVTKILNLEVFDPPADIIVYNVEFVYDTAYNVYATGFDFPISADALAAVLAVRDALNGEVPVPPGAGAQDS